MHYVLIQEPRREGVYVKCRDVDQCLVVVDDELTTNLPGTRVTMFRKQPRQTAELLAMWKVERSGARRYAINRETIAHGQQKRVKNMPAFWSTSRPAKIGLKVPPNFTKEDLDRQRLIERWGYTRQVAEEVFERVRKRKFPKRPSRAGARFVCPAVEGFCTPHAYLVYNVLVTGTVFSTDGSYFTDAWHILQPLDDEEQLDATSSEDERRMVARASGVAEDYWTPAWARPRMGAIEIVVKGSVTVVSEVEQ